jgi:hypothetical protein
MNIDKKKLEAKLKETFYGITHLSVEERFGKVTFTCGGNECSLKNLNILSELLGTDAINFQGREEEVRWSSYTSETERYGEIECFEVDMARLEKVLEG